MRAALILLLTAHQQNMLRTALTKSCLKVVLVPARFCVDRTACEAHSGLTSH